MPPKRLDTLTIGLPSVFQTAPPQPASKARMTWSPVLVGGAEASQKGFGLLMPAKSIDRSAMVRAPRDRLVHAADGELGLGDRVDDLFAAVHAVAAAPHPGVAGAARGRVDDH